MSTIGSRTVVSAGARSTATATSSKPVTDIRPGTAMPRSRSTESTPMAMSSLRARIAVTSGWAARISSAACLPPRRVKGASTTGTSAKGIPAAAKASSIPASRSATVVSDRRPATTAIRRWPRSSRCRATARPPARLSGSTASALEVVAPDHRDPATEAAVARQVGLGRGLVGGVDEAGARDDDRADAVGDEGADLLELLLGVTAGVADLHGQSLPGSHAQHAAGDLGEVGVADLVDQQPDRPGRTAREAAGVDVGDVPHVPGDTAHPLGDLLADARRARQAARGGRDRDARGLGDVLQPQRGPVLRQRVPLRVLGHELCCDPCHIRRVLPTVTESAYESAYVQRRGAT